MVVDGLERAVYINIYMYLCKLCAYLMRDEQTNEVRRINSSSLLCLRRENWNHSFGRRPHIKAFSFNLQKMPFSFSGLSVRPFRIYHPSSAPALFFFFFFCIYGNKNIHFAENNHVFVCRLSKRFKIRTCKIYFLFLFKFVEKCFLRRIICRLLTFSYIRN